MERIELKHDDLEHTIWALPRQVEIHAASGWKPVGSRRATRTVETQPDPDPVDDEADDEASATESADD